METLRLENDTLVTKWEEFTTTINIQFHPINNIEEQWSCWNYFKKKHGKNVQQYNTKYTKMFFVMSTSPKSLDLLLKYLVVHIGMYKIKVIFLKLWIVDEACVHNTWKIWYKIKGNQVAQNRKRAKKILKKGWSGKWERTRS